MTHIMLKFILTEILICLPLVLFAQNNRLNSRVFYQQPPLHMSPSQAPLLDEPIHIIVEKPIDQRANFVGEKIYKNKKAERYDDFWKKSLSESIQEKMQHDFQQLIKAQSPDGSYRIQPFIEMFYADVRGFIWMKSFAKVRLRLVVSNKDGQVVMNRTFEAFYISDGTDQEWEGPLTLTIEQSANIAAGITLRKTLDQFYSALRELL